MRVLLDTHILLWWSFGEARLSKRAREIINDERSFVYVSAVSALEIAIKVRAGKLPRAAGFINSFEDELNAQGFHSIDISLAHAKLAGLMAGMHRDPFDRVLAAQSIQEDMALISNDVALRELVPNMVW